MSAPKSSDAALRDYYARRASSYEDVYRKPERQRDLVALRERVREFLAGRRVLEIACGTGYWTEVFAATATSVVAVDVNEEVLAIARAKPAAGPRAQWFRADIWALPEFAGQDFDAGFAGFWWSHVPRSRIAGFLRGFHARLLPGARVMFLDNAYVEGSSTPLARRDAEGNTYQQRPLPDGSVHEVLKNFPTDDELRAALDGLAEAVRIARLEHFWVLEYRTRR